VVNFGSCGSVTDPGTLRMARVRNRLFNSRLCRHPFLLLSWGCTGKYVHNIMGNTKVGVVVHRKVRTCYLTFNYIPISTVSLVLKE